MEKSKVGILYHTLKIDCKPVISNLFSGYSFYFDGFLGEKTRLELVELVRIHSGNVERFYTASHVNVIIAKNLCFSKERKLMNVGLQQPY